MKFQQILPLLALSLLSSSVLAKGFIAQVEQLRGHVTQLKPGAHDASPVLLGEQILEDTSIVTGDRSFVRLKFIDGSLLNLGPSGKVVVVQMPEQGAGVISLLKGTIRTQVEKNKNPKEGENKLFVKTRSAAMGVRGTDFQTVYNPENKVTSLLTFKGEVAMATIKEEPAKADVRKIRVNNEDVEVQEVVKKPDAKVEQKQLTQALKTNETVLVKPGQFSGTVQQLETVSKPVKISPVQLNALYKNQDLYAKGEEEVAKEGVKNLKEETKKAIQENLVAQAEQEAPPEGFFNAKTKEFAPKSGGFIDLKTGLYVPPAADSEFDAQRKIYIPNKVGTVSTQTGEYAAPEGLKLDAKEGFVVDKLKVAELDQAKKDEVQKNLLAMTQDLNKTIARDLIISPEKGKSKYVMPFIAYTPRELYTKNIFSIALVPSNEKLVYSKTNMAGMDRTMKTSKGSGLQFSWLLASDGVLQPLVEFSMKDTTYEEGGIRNKTNKLYALNMGGRYYLSERTNIVAALALEQHHYLTYTTEGTSTTASPELKPVTVPKLRIGVNYTLADFTRSQVYLNGGAMFAGPREAAGLTIKSGLGLYAEMAGRYYFNQKWWGQFGLKTEVDSQKTSDSTFNGTVERSGSEFALRIGAIF